MLVEHVIDYHLHKAGELEEEYLLDKRKTRILTEVNRHRQIAYTMQRWPDFVDFTEQISAVTAFPNNPFMLNTRRS